MKLSGKTIYFVKQNGTELLRTLNINEAKELLSDFNFDLNSGIQKAKLFQATIK